MWAVWLILLGLLTTGLAEDDGRVWAPCEPSAAYLQALGCGGGAPTGQPLRQSVTPLPHTAAAARRSAEARLAAAASNLTRVMMERSASPVGGVRRQRHGLASYLQAPVVLACGCFAAHSLLLCVASLQLNREPALQACAAILYRTHVRHSALASLCRYLLTLCRYLLTPISLLYDTRSPHIAGGYVAQRPETAVGRGQLRAIRAGVPRRAPGSTPAR